MKEESANIKNAVVSTYVLNLAQLLPTGFPIFSASAWCARRTCLDSFGRLNRSLLRMFVGRVSITPRRLFPRGVLSQSVLEIFPDLSERTRRCFSGFGWGPTRAITAYDGFHKPFSSKNHLRREWNLSLQERLFQIFSEFIYKYFVIFIHFFHPFFIVYYIGSVLFVPALCVS